MWKRQNSAQSFTGAVMLPDILSQPQSFRPCGTWELSTPVCPTGGGQPVLGHVWVGFPEQRDALPLQIRWCTCLLVRMPRRCEPPAESAQKLFAPSVAGFVFTLSTFVLSDRRRLQRRGGGLVWPPASDLQQLPVNWATRRLKDGAAARPLATPPHVRRLNRVPVE